MRFRVLGSGSSGNATLVESGEARILIDAGLGARELSERLESAGVDPASLALVFLSHEHQDHACGAAAFSRKWGVRLCGSRGTYAAAGLGAEELAGYDVLEPGVPRAVGALTVLGIPVPHDAAGPLAFVVQGDGGALAHATDFGHVSRSVADGFRDCDTVLIESNYDPVMLRDGPYPWSVKERILGYRGHLSNDDVARYLMRDLGQACRMVLLAHISQNNNHPELVRMTAETALRRRGRTEVRLELASADGTGWMDVAPAAYAVKGPRQLRLF
ncbi:MAG: MBL fold metallo-hydrolase [Acidobacteria bacterium]|nr:MAG: MBL fold metallo-hydrolase [Acidobacteriota bacterium]